MITIVRGTCNRRMSSKWYRDIFHHIYNDNKLYSLWEWSTIVRGSIKSGDKYLFNYILSFVPSDYELKWDFYYIELLVLIILKYSRLL